MPLEDSDKMPFGKYKGKQMVDVPASYLLYLYGEMQKEQLHTPIESMIIDYVESNKKVLEIETGHAKQYKKPNFYHE